ncbi:Si-specific NAD(P)(+) transhydrogenase [Simkania negevensis]|uniref:Soluble pyridine nucleotide transhydrogenase n=1 Tax=Simkania negevensis TaxID=83561 RepID=A0ABS3APC9_9BACT|nr:Si-specific NAD(P)(+) transhydrogenase [Simkania negevensis]
MRSANGNTMIKKKYDLVVIGSGPAGEKAAVKAAYFQKRVAIIEKEPGRFGGAGVHTGTVPSKTLKETAIYFSGKYDKGLYGVEKALQHEASAQEFLFRKNQVISAQNDEVHRNLQMHRVDIYQGVASFEDAHTVQVQGKDEALLYTQFVLVATGSYPFHPENIPFDAGSVYDSDSILEIEKFPRSICIIGAGVIGCEYATIFATMGAQVCLVNGSDEILRFLDKDITFELVSQMRKAGVQTFFNLRVDKVERIGSEGVRTTLSSGEEVETDIFLYAAGRQGALQGLNLDKVGVAVGKREAIEVDGCYRTNVNNIFAVGDVIGFPALASTGMDQGRIAVAHMFGLHDVETLTRLLPYGIYTVPEISMVGLTEEDAKKEGISCCVGYSRYQDMTRGQIMGFKEGFMKILFNKEDQVIIGVHIIGPIASELIHFGMMLVQRQETLSDVINYVFNYPTLHDLYKYACYDGFGALSGHKVKDPVMHPQPNNEYKREDREESEENTKDGGHC